MEFLPQSMRKSIHTPQYRTLLELLVHTREARGLTQVALAHRLRTTQSSVSKVERGERRLDILELYHWCRALRVSFAEFTHELNDKLGGH
jgi:transcriptional regulator with XRE-family HTH domain